MTYRPYAGSFASLVVDFFIANPDEELTPHDMAIKWPTTPRKNIRTLLASAVQAQALIREKTLDDEFIYKAGPNIKKRIVAEAPLSSYVATAGIHPKDPPNIVVRKLQHAINLAKAQGVN